MFAWTAGLVLGLAAPLAAIAVIVAYMVGGQAKQGIKQLTMDELHISKAQMLAMLDVAPTRKERKIILKRLAYAQEYIARGVSSRKGG